MPYDNFPKDIPTEKIDSCVHDVMGKGHDKSSAVAICYSSMVEGKSMEDAMKEFSLTVKASNSPGDYLVVEDPKMPTTWHLQVKKNGTPDHTLMGAAWAALHEGYRGNKYEGPNKAEALAKLKKLYDAEGMPMPMAKEARFSIEKQADGHYRWIASTSSSYKDRDREIIAQKALEADTAQMNAAKRFGDADWWHTPIALASCDFSAMHGRISIESGVFYDDYVGEKMAQKASSLAMSRSFYHPINEPDAEGVYHNIHTFRRAFLPRGKESNLLTMLYVSKEEREMLADKIKELKQLFGGNKDAEAKVDALLQVAEQADKAAEAAGITNKEAAPVAAPEAPAPAAPDKGWFVADMKPEEFTALLVTAMKSALDPMVSEIKAIKEAQAVATKESGKEVVAKIAEVAATQAALGTRLAALEGEQPRAGFRASVSGEAPTQELKEQAPQKDMNSYGKFVSWVASTAPQPPA